MCRLIDDHQYEGRRARLIRTIRDMEWPREVAGVAMGSYVEWMRSCSRITLIARLAAALHPGWRAP
jgi:hypothetical protein